jgi:hypothetical protein
MPPSFARLAYLGAHAVGLPGEMSFDKSPIAEESLLYLMCFLLSKKVFFCQALLAPDYLQLLKMVGKFIDCCLNFPSIYTAEQ